jgi:hypothetical protein
MGFILRFDSCNYWLDKICLIYNLHIVRVPILIAVQNTHDAGC